MRRLSCQTNVTTLSLLWRLGFVNFHVPLELVLEVCCGVVPHPYNESLDNGVAIFFARHHLEGPLSSFLGFHDGRSFDSTIALEV